MEYTNFRLLLLIAFMHTMSTGMIVPIFPYHYKDHKATHLMIGVLTSLIYALGKAKRELLALLPNGMKFTLTVSLYACFVYFFILVFYNDLLSLFCVRCLWALTIDIQYVCKMFIARTEPEDSHVQMYNLVDLTRICGFTIGALVGSRIYAAGEDYSTSFLLATCLSLGCILVMQNVDSDDSAIAKDSSHFFSLPDICKFRLRQLREIELTTKWNSFMSLLTYVFICCTYWTRICYILIDKYNISYVHIGYTIAVENTIMSLYSGVVPFITERYEDRRTLLLHSMFVTGLLVAGFYTAPTYGCSLTIFSILIFFYTMVNDLLDDDVLNLRYVPHVGEAFETVRFLITVTAPVCAGIIYDFFGANAIDLLGAMSLSAYMFLIMRSFSELGDDEPELSDAPASETQGNEEEVET